MGKIIRAKSFFFQTRTSVVEQDRPRGNQMNSTMEGAGRTLILQEGTERTERQEDLETGESKTGKSGRAETQRR
jgi:hypothetical protein